MSFIKVSFLIILSLLTQLSFGDIPEEMSYQGLLTDAEGVAVDDGEYELTFRLYLSDTGAPELWSENHVSVGVVDGVFGVILGSVNPLNLEFDNQYWLGISINGSPELTPRVQLTSSPYSLNAQTVEDGAVTEDKIAANAITSGKIDNNAVTTVHILNGTIIAEDIGFNYAGSTSPGGPATDLVSIGAVDTTDIADDAVTGDKIADGHVVRSINGKMNDVTLAEGTNITITPSGNNLTISASSFSGWSLTGNSILSSNFLGSTNNQPLELRANNLRILHLDPDSNSPNIIGGYHGNIVDSGKYGATIGGGGTNGDINQVSSNYATISGGYGNTATGFVSNIGGGINNISGGQYATVGGGVGNETSDTRTTISGGQYNKASGYTATVGGGSGNEAGGYMATISGGSGGNASGDYATVPGGRDNTAQGAYSFAVGRRAKANYSGCFVWGDSTDSDFTANGGNRFMVRSSGGLWFYSNSTRSEGLRIPAGESALEAVSNNPLELRVSSEPALRLEPASECPKIILGNSSNQIRSGAYGATIGGGGGDSTPNRVFDPWGTVGGGENNRAGTNNSNYLDAKYITIGGGYGNEATHHYATIGGGQGNDADGLGGTVAGGLGNEANGYASTSPGGRYCVAAGDYSFAAGRRAKIHGNGSFMWADSTNEDFYRTTSNRFYVRSSNGIYLYTSSDLSSGTSLTAGDSSWNTLSDRASKRNIRQVDVKEVLSKLTEIPISRWSYKAQDPEIEHIGPIAQDFYAAFGLGIDDKHINTIDPDGVALAAIQGLYEMVKEKDAENIALQHQVATQQQQISQLEARMKALEAIYK